MTLKGPTEVTFKHGGGQENFRSLRSGTYPPSATFKMIGATVYVYILLQIQLAFL